MQRSLSVYLDLLRFMAAIIVVIVHANYDRFTGGLPVFSWLASLGNDAVMVFFVLSGFVIAYVTDTREKLPSEFLIARLARLWSVVVPAIILTVVLDSLGQKLSPAMYDGYWYASEHPILRVLANLLFVNELWFSSIRLFSNGPFWSIGYEFWYYAIFGCAMFLRGTRRLMVLIPLIFFIGPKILLLFPVWLAGVWAYRTGLAERLSLLTAAGLFVASMLAYGVFRFLDGPRFLDQMVISIVGREFAMYSLTWSRYFLTSYVIGACITLNFIAARAIAGHFPESRVPADRLIVYLAGFTFSLYLFHYPLLQFFAAAADYAELDLTSKRTFVVLATLTSVWVVGTWAERQKGPIKRKLTSLSRRLHGGISPASRK